MTTYERSRQQRLQGLPILFLLAACSTGAGSAAVTKLTPLANYNSAATGVTSATIPLDLTTITNSPAGTSNYLLIGVSDEGVVTSNPDPGQTVTSITWNGTSTGLVLHCSATHSGGTFKNSTETEIWYLQNPAKVSSNLVVTLSGNAALQVGAAVFQGVGSIGTCNTNTVAAGSFSFESFNLGSGSGGAIFDTIAVKTLGNTMTITPTSTPTGLTQLTFGSNTAVIGFNCTTGGCSVGGATAYFVGSLTSETETFPSSSDAAYAATALNPKPSMPPAIY